MTPTARQIEQGLLALPEKERALVIQHGLRSLNGTPDQVLSGSETVAAVMPPKKDFITDWLATAARLRSEFPGDFEIPRLPETPAVSFE